MAVAEIRRRLVVRARELEIPPPSYEHVRRLVHRNRLLRELAPDVSAMAVGVAFGTRPPVDLIRALIDPDNNAREFPHATSQ